MSCEAYVIAKPEIHSFAVTQGSLLLQVVRSLLDRKDIKLVLVSLSKK